GWIPFEAKTEERAASIATAPMTVESLGARVAAYRAHCDELDRPPGEVVFLRPRGDWLRDRTRAVDELLQCREAGVDWVSFRPDGSDRAQFGRGLDAAAEIADEAGVLCRTA